MTPTSAAELAANLDTQALTAVAHYAADLADTPAGAHYAGVTAAVAEMSRLGAEGRREAALADSATYAKQGLGEASRQKAIEAQAIAAETEAKVAALAQRAEAAHGVTEAALRASLFPALPSDPAVRALARQQILQATDGKRGMAAAAAVRELLGEGNDAAVAAELMSAWGEQLMDGPAINGARPRDIFLKEAVATLSAQPRHARTAAKLSASAQARGAIHAARSAAQLRIK